MEMLEIKYVAALNGCDTQGVGVAQQFSKLWV